MAKAVVPSQKLLLWLVWILIVWMDNRLTKIGSSLGNSLFSEASGSGWIVCWIDMNVCRSPVLGDGPGIGSDCDSGIWVSLSE